MLRPYLAVAGGPMAGTVELGAGDDAALWRSGAQGAVAVTTDSLVEDVHFRRPADTAAAQDLGWKLLAISYSDLAAMGARPGPAFISLSLPGTWEVAWVEALYQGLVELVAAHGGGLAGGNITAAKGAVLTSSCLGEVDASMAMRRQGAEPGWLLAVTGEVGGAAAALRGKPEEAWRRRLARPQPRLSAGAMAAELGVHTAIDISDGLFADAARLLGGAASGGSIDTVAIGVTIDAAAIPAAPGIRERWPRDWLDVAGGGEDYELLLAGSPQVLKPALLAIEAAGTPARVIGSFDRGEGVRVLVAGEERPAPEVGHQHFG
ncbi:MAG: thiamine-phosphate kinase [Candidatus Dormibacteraeota bacterium]|nr:thiamine-phosphate kinase [Candidatus Dormibacteraeota bacterium]